MLIKTKDLAKAEAFIKYIGQTKFASLAPTAQRGITRIGGLVGASGSFTWRGGCGGIGVAFALYDAGIQCWDCSDAGYREAFAAVGATL